MICGKNWLFVRFFSHSGVIAKLTIRPTQFGRNSVKNRNQILPADHLFSYLFPRLLVFIDENHEIRNRFKAKTFF